VIFVDEEKIPLAETGALIAALSRVCREAESWEWTNCALWLG